MNAAYVKSHTIVGDGNHAEGVVLAEIVKANIPVKNGVVHLIHRPLMVVDTTVTQFLEVRTISNLFYLKLNYSFYNLFHYFFIPVTNCMFPYCLFIYRSAQKIYSADIRDFDF